MKTQPSPKSARRIFLAGVCLIVASLVITGFALFRDNPPVQSGGPVTSVRKEKETPQPAETPLVVKQSPKTPQPAVQPKLTSKEKAMKYMHNYRFIDGHGKVNPNLAMDLKLSQEQFRGVETAWAQLRAEITRVARGQLKDETTDHDREWGITRYTIQPYEADGQKCLSRFKEAVSKALGEELAEKALADFQPHMYFADMGRNSVTLTFQEAPANKDSDAELTLKAQEIDPVNHAKIVAREGELAVIAGYYPDVFQIK